jgi:hypothetical protein
MIDLHLSVPSRLISFGATPACMESQREAVPPQLCVTTRPKPARSSGAAPVVLIRASPYAPLQRNHTPRRESPVQIPALIFPKGTQFCCSGKSTSGVATVAVKIKCFPVTFSTIRLPRVVPHNETPSFQGLLKSPSALSLSPNHVQLGLTAPILKRLR